MTVPSRYSRNVSALSEDEVLVLGTKRVAVVGAGGLGGTVIEVMARIGVGHLRVVDGDVFEESNLNRQLLSCEANLGQSKAMAAVKRVSKVNSAVEVEPFACFLTEENAASLLEDCDCVVDCLDNLEARFWVARCAAAMGVPVVYGAIAGWFGQVCTVFPGDVSFVEIYGSTEGESQHLKLGNLPFTAMAVASFQAAECVKVLLGRPGLLRNRLLMIDLLDGSAEEMPLG